METLTREVQTESIDETVSLGQRLGVLLEMGDFIGLTGTLGAGKTQLIRGIAQGAGVAAGEVASPTFAIVYPYEGRLPLFHADLYRLESEDEAFSAGLFDLLDQGAMLVEWIEKVPRLAPHNRLQLTLHHAGEQARRIEATAYGERHVRLLANWR